MSADLQGASRRRRRVAGRRRPGVPTLASPKSGTQWPGWIRCLLFIQLAVAMVFQTLIARADLREYAVDIPAAFSVLFWTVSALSSALALVGLGRRKNWWAPPLLISETLIALSSAYVLWVDYTSPYPDTWLRRAAWLFLLTALAPVLPLGVRLTQLPGKAWAGGLAALSAFGLTQFVVENQILPSRQRPTVDVEVSLSESARSGNFSTLRGIVTFKNEGKATVTVVNGFLELRAVGDSSQPDAPLDPVQVASTLNPIEDNYQSYSRTLPPNATAGVVWLGELSVAGSFLSPDITDRREFTVQVDRRRGTNFDLRATASMFTNARLDATQLVSCDGTAVRNKQFLGVPEKLVPDVSGGATTCFRWPIQPRNSVRAKLGDRPRIEFGYDFAATAGGPAGPWLAELTAEDKPTMTRVVSARPIASTG